MHLGTEQQKLLWAHLEESQEEAKSQLPQSIIAVRHCDKTEADAKAEEEMAAQLRISPGKIKNITI